MSALKVQRVLWGMKSHRPIQHDHAEATKRSQEHSNLLHGPRPRQREDLAPPRVDDDLEGARRDEEGFSSAHRPLLEELVFQATEHSRSQIRRPRVTDHAHLDSRLDRHDVLVHDAPVHRVDRQAVPRDQPALLLQLRRVEAAVLEPLVDRVAPVEGPHIQSRHRRVVSADLADEWRDQPIRSQGSRREARH
jgi:hypothetical protein